MRCHQQPDGSIHPRRPGIPVRIYDYGDMAYPEAIAALAETADKRAHQRVSDSLLLLEHPPTYTLGLRAKTEHLLVAQTELEKQGIPVFRVDRGGDITFHGPGQLVGYPVLDLNARRLDIRRYVRGLERVIIRSLADFGVKAHRVEGFPGVWAEHRKVAAIGVKINAAGVSSHGFALNVNTDLRFFDAIIPCGLRGAKVASLAQLTGHRVDMDRVKQSVSKAFLQEFQI